jgi:hypothetical protein
MSVILNNLWSLCIFTSCVSFCCCCCRCVICYWLYLLVDYGSILSHISKILYMYNTLTFFICCLIPVLYFYDCILYSFYARKIWNFHNKVQNIKNIEKGHLKKLLLKYIEIFHKTVIVLLQDNLKRNHIKYVWFVFTSSCLSEGACLIYIICFCMCIVLSNTCCVVFLFFFLRLVYPMLSVSLDCPFSILQH